MHVKEFDPAPLDTPNQYPGKWPTRDFLMVGACLFHLDPLPGRRLEQARISSCGKRRHWIFGDSRFSVPLSYGLLRTNVTPISARRPFLSVGSNANPAQLFKKLSARGVSTVVPLTQVDALGVTVGFSQHVFTTPNDNGQYVPTTAVLAEESTTKLTIAWLDTEQAKALNTTEKNYKATVLDREFGATFTLGSGERLEEVIAYLSVWGHRKDENGKVITLAGNQEERTQQQVSLLSKTPTESATVPEHSSDDWQQCSMYISQGGVRGDGDLVVPTNASASRNGDSVVCLSKSEHEKMGRPEMVLVKASLSDGAANDAGVVARARIQEDLRAGTVALDQVARNAMGIEVRERVHVAPAERRRFNLGFIVARYPVYTFCRVQAAPLVAMERGIVLLEPIAMQVMGVESGDRVVLEGVPLEAGKGIPRQRLRAVSASESLIAERKELTGGGSESRFPSGLDALGVWPDLSWAFIDKATRAKLNLDQSKVAAVRIRASRRDLLLKETRELVLVLALAAIGLLALIQNPVGRLLSIGAITLIGITIVTTRLRRRVAKGSG